MENKRHNKALAIRKTVVAQALAVAFGAVVISGGSVSTAFAQSADGSIYGQAKAGATVTVTSLDTGSTRQIQAEGGGTFNLAKLPPGRYKVSSGGVTREVQVSVGSGSRVSLTGEAALETVQVTGSRERSAIDVSSVESNTVFTQEQLRYLPVAANVNSVALLAPGVVKGFSTLGDGTLPSFGGASVAENGYYINGFDVTNIRNFTSYANLPFESIAEQQIKTGGYGAEYGRSLGGVVSLVTKRGTNEWKGGASVQWEPKALRSSGKNVNDLDPDRVGKYLVFNKDDTEDNLSTNLYVGGPLLKDKLYFFGLVQNQRNVTTNYGLDRATVQSSGTPNTLIKFDFLPTDQHRLELTHINNKKRDDITDYANSKDYSTSLDGVGKSSERNSGGDVLIGKYTGYLTDDLTVSALWGRVNDKVPVVTGARTAGESCPVVLDVGLNEIGCWEGPFPGVGSPDPKAPPNKDTRNAFRFDLDYTLGSHNIRAGIDNQKFTSSEAGGSAYTGGIYWRYFSAPPGGQVNGATWNQPYVRGRVVQSTTGEYVVENKAYYVEDSWRITKNVLLYGGLRWESFDNKNGDGTSFVKADNLLAPRFGAAWDVNGDSSFKVYGNYGRYYIPVASNTNIRATRGELFYTDFYGYSAIDPVTKAPTTTTKIGNTAFTGDGALPDPATIADTQLKPMSQDEIILGFQRSIAKNLVAGVKYTHRSINDGMDDWCDRGTLSRELIKQGYSNFDYHTAAGCMIVNPGRDINLKADVNNDGKFVPVTIPAAATGLAKYERNYDSLEFSLEKQFDGKWGGRASYAWSKSIGTAEGYVISTLGQDDAGITQDFDFGSFTDGAYGALPNDRTHAIKVFGTYALSPEYRIGFGYNGTSGAPRNCLGFVPKTVRDYYGPTPGNTSDGAGAYASASAFYCVDDSGNSVLTPRGSAGRNPWTHTFDMQFAYTPNIGKNKLTLQADIFNLFDAQAVTEVAETRDYSRGTSGNNPGTGQVSANYLQPTSYQGPRAVRLTARYEF